jgi:hypothetical protein
MSLRNQARKAATDIYRQALQGIFGLIENRIQWRRANACLLALESERMIHLLATARSFVAFRKLRVTIWRTRYRKHAARAYAQNRTTAHACALEAYA